MSNEQSVGTCGECGGPVTVPAFFWSVVPPTPSCRACGSVPANAHGPVLPMKRGSGRWIVAGVAIAALFTATGCTVALRGPAENHSVVAQVAADACRGEGGNLNYPEAPCSPDLQADLDALAHQAECLRAGLHGEKCALKEGEK